MTARPDAVPGHRPGHAHPATRTAAGSGLVILAIGLGAAALAYVVGALLRSVV
jgi:hypothetical protein